MNRRKHHELAERLRLARHAKGWSQEQLAEAAELSRDAVARLERGERGARLETIECLGDALGVPVSQLLDEPPIDPRLARLGAVLKHADDATFELLTSIARELLDFRSAEGAYPQLAETRAPYGDERAFRASTNRRGR